MTYYVYMLCCADNTFYTGITSDIDRRIAEHNNSTLGARYTRARRPVRLIYQTSHANRGEALREEARIKKMTRKQKEAFLVEGGDEMK